MRLFIYRENQEYGPYSLEQVKGFIDSGHISPEDYARTEDSQEWQTLKALLDSPISINPPEASLSPEATSATGKVNNTDSKPEISQKAARSILIAIGLLLLAVLPAVVTYQLVAKPNQPATAADKETELSNNIPNQPQDPGNHKVLKLAFKIVQIVSPGQAIVQKDYGILYNVQQKLYEDNASTEDPDCYYYLAGIPDDLVDGDKWKGPCFEDGTVSYPTNDNATKTVHCYVVATQPSNK